MRLPAVRLDRHLPATLNWRTLRPPGSDPGRPADRDFLQAGRIAVMGDSMLSTNAGSSLRLPPSLAHAAREWPDDGCSRVFRTGSTPTRRFSRASNPGCSARTTGSMSASKRNSPTRATSNAASLARATSSPCAARDGAINVLVNRCAHRSMQVCTASRGSTKEFVCPYHQWTYDLSGNLLGLAVPSRLSRPRRHAGGFPPGGAWAATPRGDAPARRGVRQLRRAQRDRWKPSSATACWVISTACSTAASWWCSAICGSAFPATGS